MPIIKIKGGLGNQMFQYAYGRQLQLKKHKKVVFDTSFFEENTKDTSRLFLLDKFNINLSDFRNIKRNKIQLFLNKYKDKILLRLIKDYSFYQKEKYFIDIQKHILKEFTLKDELSQEAKTIRERIIQVSNSVSIHIRRGDYINNKKYNKHHGVCGIDYYKNAINYIKQRIQNPIFFIFSDDITWVRQNFLIENAIYVSNANIKDYEELYLMSLCKNNIIANSTFSWWGAYLNKNENKIVIAPIKWTTKKTSRELDILPSGWVIV